MINTKIIAICFILLLFLQCNSISSNKQDKQDIQNYIKNNESQILQSFYGISCTRRGDIITLTLYDNVLENSNTYFYRLNEDNDSKTFSLIRDSVNFNISQLKRFKNVKNNNLNYNMESFLTTLLNKMDSLRIREITSEYGKMGIDLKIYLKPSGVILFSEDITKVNNAHWQTYLNKSYKIDEQWYWNEN